MIKELKTSLKLQLNLLGFVESSTIYLFSKRFTHAVCCGTKESSTSTTKGKNDNKQKEQSLSLGGTSLPFKVHAAG